MTNAPAPKAWVPALDVPVPDWRRGRGDGPTWSPFDGLFSVPKFEYDDVVGAEGVEPPACWL